MELRACYFCGSPAGLDTYPVVPERVAATPAGEDPGRVVLCPDCRAKLERVLDCVLGAVDAASVDGGGAVSTTPPPADEGGFSAEITFGDDAADGPRVGDSPDRADASDAVEGTDADRDAGIDGGSDPSIAPGEGDGSRAPDAPAGSDEPPTSTEASAGDEGDGADGPSGELRGLGDSGTGQYRQALRLLQNREFPMPRSDLVEVMASAYDLSRTECDRLVDFAVDRGWLTDDGGVLRRD